MLSSSLSYVDGWVGGCSLPLLCTSSLLFLGLFNSLSPAFSSLFLSSFLLFLLPFFLSCSLNSLLFFQSLHRLFLMLFLD